MSHTKGNWKFDGSVSVEADGNLIALVYSSDADGLGGTNLGDNARLIAAAPDLLEALEQLAGSFDKGTAFTELNNARAAIAKATGRSE